MTEQEAVLSHKEQAALDKEKLRVRRRYKEFMPFLLRTIYEDF